MSVRSEEEAPPGGLRGGRRWTGFGGVYPAFGSIPFGPGGSIWVQRPRPWSSLSEDELARMVIWGTPPAAPEFDVFDSNGRFMGVVQVPSGFQLHGFRGTVAYGVWLDELDVPYVVGLRIDGLRGNGQDR